MTKSTLRRDAKWFEARSCLIGVVHLGPLPGSPRFAGSMDRILTAAVRDAKEYGASGFHAVIVENFGDAPFHPARVPAETIAALAIAAGAVKGVVKIPVGVNCLRNDGLAAIAIAAAAELDFIRVNVYVGAAVADQGILRGEAHEITRARARLAPGVRVFADVHVKHATPLGDRPIEDEALDAVQRGLADAVVMSGSRTGMGPDVDSVERVARALRGSAPVFLGSGLDVANAPSLLAVASGAIVGTSVKRNAVTAAAVDGTRARALVKVARALAR